MLKRSPILRKPGQILKRVSIAKQSKNQKVELARRRKLKIELLKECPVDSSGRKICPKCKKLPDFRGLQLIHKIALSRGGKTDRTNVEIQCAPCHFGHKGHRTEGMK